MNDDHDHHHGDDRLRRALRAAAPREDLDSTALQARVLAQWRQCHPEGATPMGAGLLGLRAHHPGRWLGAAALAGGMALTLAWCSVRPDPAMEELMQLDVLSQIAIGEM